MVDPEITKWASVIADQLEMNRVTFRQLQEMGLEANTRASLDFFYDAPDDSAASQLEAYLRSETTYAVECRRQQFENDTWLVTGSTPPTQISLETLDQWVRWMVLAGAKYECEFDGWGTDSGSWQAG